MTFHSREKHLKCKNELLRKPFYKDASSTVYREFIKLCPKLKNCLEKGKFPRFSNISGGDLYLFSQITDVILVTPSLLMRSGVALPFPVNHSGEITSIKIELIELDKQAVSSNPNLEYVECITQISQTQA